MNNKYKGHKLVIVDGYREYLCSECNYKIEEHALNNALEATYMDTLKALAYDCEHFQPTEFKDWRQRFDCPKCKQILTLDGEITFRVSTTTKQYMLDQKEFESE